LTGTADLCFAQAGSAASPHFAPSGLWFDRVRIGQIKTLWTRVVNSEESAITIEKINKSAPQFTLVGVHLPFTLAAGKSRMLAIAFKPSAIGYIDGTVLLLANHGRATLRVHGGGAKPLPTSGALRANPPSLGFGSVRVGSKKAEFVTLTNRAAREIRIS